MNNSEVRAHLRKGELAVTVLETLGYRFETDPANANRTIWVAPEPTPEDTVAKAVKDLIETQTKAGIDVFKRSLEHDKHGPNWHIVKELKGKYFRVRPENIPELHPLRNFGDSHFRARNYKALDITYERSKRYTGYLVCFEFNTRPYTPEVVRLPLSCAAFQ
ncbi:hypothetical protein PssvBMR1_gp22 [Pseudomonas phage MR1]|uniref:Uncharacterized protein n=1 Tax=Pseudomonas phage MR1 TaxID=2711169 RepID=A0A6M3TCJ9_9CAUD|nr:hypothetical protein PssvBMR1_gp22 [Pseudomonas phage MR1]